MKNFLLIALAVILASAGSGCYNDKQNELYPIGTCDTSSVTFSASVNPVMQSQCALSGCHSSTNPQSGVDLSSYAGVKAASQDGSFLGSINHDAGYSTMPQNATKLPECQISKIRAWVNAGALNN